MDPTKKTTHDDASATKLLAEHEGRGRGAGFTAAEQQALRELIGYADVLKELVTERRWKSDTWKRMSTTGMLVKT